MAHQDHHKLAADQPAERDDQKPEATSALGRQDNEPAPKREPQTAKQPAKPNGLRNRIIQRPPPLILDKVSNFYETPAGETQQPSGPANANANSANHKFWASLNQNANRARGNQRQREEALGSGKLGADLIITRRNNVANSTTTLPSARRAQPADQQPAKRAQSSSALTALDRAEPLGPDFGQAARPGASQNATDAHRPHDTSNGSEPDDGVASETGGGNLIGIDNPPTPPTLAADEPPASATSSRPRSNNPFLVTDEELADIDEQAAFHTRPASFIAATSDKTPAHRQPSTQIDGPNLFEDTNGDGRRHFARKLAANETTNDIADGLQQASSFFQQEANNTTRCASERDSVYVGAQPEDQNDNNSHPHKPVAMQTRSHLHHQEEPPEQQQQQHQQHHRHNHAQLLSYTHQPIYAFFNQNPNYANHEPTISLDSESAVSQPPPSATMQLSHWTEAIYELNNAIIETSSVAGGAENGQFIYIVESGDIILELDSVKVSGFTLAEFKELLESKPVHLLRAVQTKHSHSLTTELRHYLALKLHKDSTDKELQNVVRENIYRRTIPCTTRAPKDGELDKVDYHFLTKEQFIELNNRGVLLECGMYGGHYYGTMRPSVDLDSLNFYGTVGGVPENMRQPLTSNHPALGLPTIEAAYGIARLSSDHDENPLYENHETVKIHQAAANHHVPLNDLSNKLENLSMANRPLPRIGSGNEPCDSELPSSILTLDDEALPHGWEKVIDQTHGTYYIDHNTQRTQYERPYEIELTKGVMGFGFTLVEADNGLLLVRTVIPGGPAYLSGVIRPGDILVSAVGVSVSGLVHTDVGRLFSTFAVGDRIRLTFARSTYVVDANLVPDEFLFSNGTNGDFAIATNSDYAGQLNQNMVSENPHGILVNQEFEFISVTLKRGDQGFGFTISDSIAGQKVRKIQNNDVCANLKQGDVLLELNGENITKFTHKEVVERLKNCPPGQDVTLLVKRKKRFRSKTPNAMHTDNDEYSLHSTPQRNCKTPSLDGLMLRRTTHPSDPVSRSLFNDQQSYMSNPLNRSTPLAQPPLVNPSVDAAVIYGSLPPTHVVAPQPTYGVNQLQSNEEHLYHNQQTQHYMSLPISSAYQDTGIMPHYLRPSSISNSEGLVRDNATTSVNYSEASLPPIKFANVSGISQMNQYNNFMHNDKLMMMQLQQQQQQQQQTIPHQMAPQQMASTQNLSDYQHMPLYSNSSEILKAEANQMPPVPVKPSRQYMMDQPYHASNSYQNDYYANNEEIALQRVQYEGLYGGQTINMTDSGQHQFVQAPYGSVVDDGGHYEREDEYELLQIDLHRVNTESNWGIRLIGGAEVDRAISIGSIVFGGAASKNGTLKSGDEIISIDGTNVVGSTHQNVVRLISQCKERASLVVRRKKYAEMCEVVLTRNMDEGFGFVIISSRNCALIGRIIEGSPADRCQQLHVRDQIIAVNGCYITPDMQHPEIVNMIKKCGSTLRLCIIPVDCYTVELIKSAQSDNFGFSMRGGSEYDGTPLYILRVAENGLARDILNKGDQILEINNIPTVGMTHRQAASIIKFSDPIVKLKLRRNYEIPPSLLVDSPRELQKFNQVTAEMKPVNQNVTPNFNQQQEAHSVSSDLEAHYHDQSQQQQQQHSSLVIESHAKQQQQPVNTNDVISQNLSQYMQQEFQVRDEFSRNNFQHPISSLTN